MGYGMLQQNPPMAVVIYPAGLREESLALEVSLSLTMISIYLCRLIVKGTMYNS